MAEQQQRRYTVEASPVGCLEKNLTLTAADLRAALDIAAKIRTDATAPAVVIKNERGELVAAG